MISSRQQFTLLTDNMLEVLLTSEQKLQYDSLPSRLTAARYWPRCAMAPRSGAREI